MQVGHLCNLKIRKVDGMRSLEILTVLTINAELPHTVQIIKTSSIVVNTPIFTNTLVERIFSFFPLFHQLNYKKPAYKQVNFSLRICKTKAGGF